jgi:ubiquinone/menaquinone biosynthesis C-methylase UbiE
MVQRALSQDFYERVNPRLYQRIGRELRLASRIFDLGCAACDLVTRLASRYEQRITGLDISSRDFPAQVEPAARSRIRCIQKDAGHLDFVSDQTVGAVVIARALHEMQPDCRILQKARRNLWRPNQHGSALGRYRTTREACEGPETSAGMRGAASRNESLMGK